MFYNCRSISFLDISNWNITNEVNSSEYMFKNCISLSIIYNINNIGDEGNIFDENINNTFVHVHIEPDNDSSDIDLEELP